MENRFGFKDLIVTVLLLALLISVWLAMKQYDRQWEQLRAIRARIDEQGRDIIDLRRTLSSGVALAPGAGSRPTTQPSDPFERIRKAKELPGYAEGGMLVDAFGNSVGKLTPLVSSDAYASTVQAYVLESLADRDPDTLEWKPLLSQSWRTVERVKERQEAIAKLKAAGKTDEQIAADKSVPPAITITFKMRPGVRFSDGAPLTADDVVFTFQFTMNPKVNAPRDRAYLQRIKNVEKTARTRWRSRMRSRTSRHLSWPRAWRFCPGIFTARLIPSSSTVRWACCWDLARTAWRARPIGGPAR